MSPPVPPSPVRLPIAVRDLAGLLGLGGDGGGPRESVFAEATEGRSTLGLADVFRLLRRLAFAAGEETFALSARPMMTGTAELVFSRAAGAATVGEALRQIASAYNVLHGAPYNRVEHKGGQLVFGLFDDDFPYTRPRDDYLHFSLECTLIFVHAAVCELAQADLTSRVVRITTRRTDPTGACAGGLAFWDAPVAYGARVYSLAYHPAVEALPMHGLRPGLAPDVLVHNRILELIERPAGHQPLRHFADDVRRALVAGATDQDAIARNLGLSVATLRRRLAEERTSFRSLRREVMNDYACARILEAKALAVVSEELGFSDPRAFTRAFKAWNGVTPSDYRLLHTGEPLSENVP